jgi:hypothetical protein
VGENLENVRMDAVLFLFVIFEKNRIFKGFSALQIIFWRISSSIPYYSILLQQQKKPLHLKT